MARNKAIKKLGKANNEHFIALLGKPNKKFWNELKKYKDKEDATTLSRIVVGQREVTSSKAVKWIFTSVLFSVLSLCIFK